MVGDVGPVQWRLDEVRSPSLARPVPVVAAHQISYIANANRLQNVNIYLPGTPENSRLAGASIRSLPGAGTSTSQLPRYLVHVHGGAWRDPALTSASVEATVAHAFSSKSAAALSITAIASINYTVSPFPTHPTVPYDSLRDNHVDPGRDAVHPQHVSDVLHALALLRSFGMADRSYVLSGHSCGACLVLQAILESPQFHRLGYLSDAPCPAAVLGLNGLYDLPALVHDLDQPHQHLRAEYEGILINALGPAEETWSAASPALFGPEDISARVKAGYAPRLILLDQSPQDQLVPLNQIERLEANLSRVPGLRVVRGRRCTGTHEAPWRQGDMIWQSLQDVIGVLKQDGRA